MSITSTIMKILIILFSLFSLSHFVLGYKSGLVKIACHETDLPEICVKCIESDPGADLATKVGIASAMIKCLKGRGSYLGSEMAKLASNSKEPQAKKILDICSKSYLTSNRNLSSAIEDLKVNKYDDAEKITTQALLQQVSCHDYINDYKKIELSEKVKYEMKIYEDLIQVADRIIEKL